MLVVLWHLQQEDGTVTGKRKRKIKGLSVCCGSLSGKIPDFSTFQWPVCVLFVCCHGYFASFVLLLSTALPILCSILVKYGKYCEKLLEQP